MLQVRRKLQNLAGTKISLESVNFQGVAGYFWGTVQDA